jgi:hypothetical protein
MRPAATRQPTQHGLWHAKQDKRLVTAFLITPKRYSLIHSTGGAEVRRMFKKAVQQGRRQEEPEAYRHSHHP